MHAVILTGVQNGHISLQKNCHSLPQMHWLKLNFQLESHSDAIAFFIFSLFNVNFFFFSFLVVIYACTFPPY